MTDVSFVDLVVRMIVSLGVVLGLMFGAYWFLRRRQGFIGTPSVNRARLVRPGRVSRLTPGPARGAPARATGNRRGLRVLGRVGVARTTQVVALQFGERVLLVGASDTSAPTVLAELDLATWTAVTEQPDPSTEELVPLVRDAIDPRASRPTSLIDSLREATLRRG